MPSPFESWDLQKVRERVGGLRDEDAERNWKFYSGDHWQGGEGWAAQLPDGSEKVEALRKQFTPEPLIPEAVDNHRDGVIGREPLWRFVPRQVFPRRSPRRLVSRLRGALSLVSRAQPDQDQDGRIAEIEGLLTEIGDERDHLLLYQRLTVTLLLYGRVPVRLYVPRGLRDERGALRAINLDTALRFFYLDTPDPLNAGVFTDDDTKRQVGLFLFSHEGRQRAELTYLNDAGDTILRIIEERGVVEETTLALGGRLLMYELRGVPLIGETERKNQRLANLAKTALGANTETAGWRERNYLDVQPPGYYEDADGNVWTPGSNKPRGKFVQITLPTGPRVDRFLQGADVYGPDGKFAGTATPRLAYQDPAPVEVIERVIANTRHSILARTGQLYLLMSGDATATGVSRIQARAVHEARLGRTKVALDGFLRWEKETHLAAGAAVLRQPQEYADLRVEANMIIETGPLTPDEQRVIVERVEKGLLSLETALALLGADDPDAEKAKIRAEREEADEVFERTLTPLRPNPPAAGDVAAVVARELGGE